MIRFVHKGDFRHSESFFRKAQSRSYLDALTKYGELGVEALAASTPKRSGETASSWSFEIEEKGNGYALYWSNSHINKGVNIAVILQYGHGTGTGGYVQGIDYINPAIRPIFEEIADAAWKEVTST